MNHRERVVSAIKHQKVDRVPFDFWAEQPAINRLCSFRGTRYLDSILKDFGVDIRHIDAGVPPEEDLGDFIQNFWGERYVYRETEWGVMREDMPGALSGARNMSELENFDWPVPDDLDYSGLVSECSRYDNYALMYGFADIWQRPCLVRGMENALLDLYVNPEWVHFLSRKFTDFYIEDYTNAYRRSSGRIDIFLVISDLGSQGNPLISPAMFDEFIAPYLKELVDCIHGLGAFAMFHTCGMIFPFIERLIDIGVDILDPIQPVAPEMSPENLKKKFSGRICFHGGIDTQNILSRGTPDEVKAEIQRYMKVFGTDGGYICSPAHLFQPDVPPENITAFYDTSGTSQ
jgi:uroporphyrinogen decarboxylase